LSIVYKDLSINDSIISLDEFGDSVNDLSIRAHYSSPNLKREYGIDLFNNAAIFPGEQFVNWYDDIELRVYSQRPTSNLMICSDINKSPTLSVQCINLVKKCDEKNGTILTVTISKQLEEEGIIVFWDLSPCISLKKRKIPASCSLSLYNPSYIIRGKEQ